MLFQSLSLVSSSFTILIESPVLQQIDSRGYILLSRNDDHPYIGIVLPDLLQDLRPIAIRQGIVQLTTSGFSWSWAKNSRGDSIV